MITYELDPDVVRWGLHLLDVCSLSDAGSHGSITQYETNLGQVECVQEGYCDTDHINVENDEIIAHALQEEYSSLAAAEVCEGSHSSEDHSQESVLAQDWRGPPSMHCDLGPKTDQREAHPASYFHPGEESPDVVDWPSLPEITDDSALDGEVGKRLNKMVSIPHVPKINGEIPSIDEATSDHQRLIDRLQLYGLDELKVQGDGNCQFRALSDQFYRTPDHHKFVRQQVTSQLKSHPDKYDNYVPMGYSDYLKKMSKVGEWGDHVTLQAAADSYGVRIFVLTSFKDTCYIEILPQIEKSKRVICLSFWAEVHYNSIYPEGELPVPETKKKKKWWLFGS